jgi:hypothetical protein
MPTGPKGEKRPADVIGNAVKVMRNGPLFMALLVGLCGLASGLLTPSFSALAIGDVCPVSGVRGSLMSS